MSNKKDELVKVDPSAAYSTNVLKWLEGKTIQVVEVEPSDDPWQDMCNKAEIGHSFKITDGEIRCLWERSKLKESRT